MNKVKNIIHVDRTKKYSAKEIAEIMFDSKAMFGVIDWKTPEWFDIFPSLDRKLIEMAVAYLYENKKIEIFSVYPYRFRFTPEKKEVQLTSVVQEDDREKYCKISDISKTLFKNKKDYDNKFTELTPIENSIVVHWRSHPDSKCYFTILEVTLWAGCSSIVAEDMLNNLVKLGFVKKIDDSQFKTTDINYGIHGI